MLILQHINITIFSLHIKNRRLWIAKITFSLAFLKFLKVNGSFSITHLTLSFLWQSYKIAKLLPLWISDGLLWSTKKWKNNNKIDKQIKKHRRYIYWAYHWFGRTQGPWVLQPHGNNRFEILCWKIFTPRQ